MVDGLIMVAVILTIVSTLGSFVAVAIRNTSVVDTFWSIGPLVANWVLFIIGPSGKIQMLFSILISVWSIRLIYFFLSTRILKGHQDKRYTLIEEKWTGNKWLSTVRHFYMQATLQWLLCMAIIPIYFGSIRDMSWFHAFIAVLFLIGFIGEWVADHQKLVFKSTSSDKVCRYGLWGVCRHPNYFFEWMMWVALALFSYEYIISWLSPLSIFIVMRFITGPYTERLSLEKRGDIFRQYQDDVPMFFPSISLIFKKIFS